ncbi:MAG: YgaP family membrane protein [Saprospiraceae bacterium]
MTPNMGKLDRSIRLGVAAIIIGLYFMNIISGTAAIILGVVAGIFILTSFVNFCPLYTVLGIRTNKK